MRSYLAVALATLVLAAPISAAQPQPAMTSPTLDPAALALGHEIVDIAFPPERRQAMVDKLMATVLEQMKAGLPLNQITDPGLRAILFDYIDTVPQMLRPSTATFIPMQMDAIAQAYARMFTLPQLKDIAAFAHTPSGMAFLQRSTDVLVDPAVAAVNTEYFRKTQAITQQSAAELGLKVTEYIRTHPDAAKGFTRPAQ